MRVSEDVNFGQIGQSELRRIPAFILRGLEIRGVVLASPSHGTFLNGLAFLKDPLHFLEASQILAAKIRLGHLLPDLTVFWRFRREYVSVANLVEL